MKRVLLLAALSGVLAAGGRGQSGALELTARVTPTAARPEPVRQFTFYMLTKSYREILHEVEERDGAPSRAQFIDQLSVSPEFRQWLHKHDTLDVTLPGFDKQVTADDVLGVPEFLEAYQRANGGGVTAGLPAQKFREADRTRNPERYEKQKQEYLAALAKFV